MIPTLPLRPRNRLAETVLAGLHDGQARAALAALEEPSAAERWLEPEARGHAGLVCERARRAMDALRERPLTTAEPPLDDALAAAAALFDAGLGFEVHELLEPYWRRARGDEREALQGLIQIAVGYQHLANHNLSGARALLDEGGARLSGRQLAGLEIEAFARAVRASIERMPALEPIPRFPRKRG